MIYKKKLILPLVMFCLCINPSFAAQSGTIQYDDYLMDYSKLNMPQIRDEADYYFTLAIQSETKELRDQYIDIAQAKYYLLVNLFHDDINSAIQLARIYDYKKKNRIAKEYFYKATNIDSFNPYANFYFGEFYFKRNDYKRALRYYTTAYNNGLSSKFDLNYNMGIIHEKLADLVNAQKYYTQAFNLNPQKTELQEKINSINELNYDQSEYYHIIRE